MTKRLTWVLVLALAGCDGGGETGEDAGTERDSGTSSGIDAGPTDGGGGGQDAGPPDSGPADAGPPTCEMGRIRIEETCTPALTACGGDLLRGGTSAEWCYADVCVTKDELLATALAQAGEFLPGCTAEAIDVVSSSGTIEGTITFTDTGLGTTVTRTGVVSRATGTFDLPPECLLAGGPQGCRATGTTIDFLLRDNELGSASCEQQDGKCYCDITFTDELNETDVAYTVDAVTNEIVLASGRRFAYCIEDDGALRFNEDDSTGLEPGTQMALPVE